MEIRHIREENKRMIERGRETEMDNDKYKKE